jgi:hypothetical protein
VIPGAFARWGKWNNEPVGGAVPQTFETASPDAKNRPRSQLPENLAAVVPPKTGKKTHSAQSGCFFQNFIADLGIASLLSPNKVIML